jgi:CBS domain-containing protein
MIKKPCTARDIMTKDVVKIESGTSLRELERIFLEKGISGAPVVDEAGGLVGVISQTDLVYYHLTRGDKPSRDSDFYRMAELEARFEGSGFHVEEYDIGWVHEMMTPVVHTAGPDTPVSELAQLMILARIHRVIITENQKVVGLVSAMDLMSVLADLGKQARASKESHASRIQR